MADVNFPSCLAFTLRWEGGRSDDHRDPGGRTFNGVTQTVYDTDRVERHLPKQDVYLMSEEERDAIYRKRYWAQIGGDQLRAGEDLAAFDFAVNSGPARANAALTRAAASNAGPEEVAHSICRSRLSFMHAVTKGGGWRVFGRGWGRRVSACEALAVRMVHGTAAGPILEGKARGAANKSHNAKVNAVLSGGAGTLGSAQPAISGHQWVDIALFIGAVAAMTVFWFAASRDSQREEAFRAEAAKEPSQKKGNPGNRETSSLVTELSGAP